MYDSLKHHRKSIRLLYYDYSKEGSYFITLNCQDRQHLFGKIVNGKMILSEYGKIAEEELLNTPKVRNNVTLAAYAVMPDHIHALITINYRSELTTNYPEITSGERTKAAFRSPSQTIGAIVRGYKGAVTKRINTLRLGGRLGEVKGGVTGGVKGELQFAQTQATQAAHTTLLKVWQRNYYECIVWSARSYIAISLYIHANPKNWGIKKKRRSYAKKKNDL